MGPTQNSAVENSVAGHEAAHFSVYKVLTGEELPILNDQLEMVFALSDTWVNFHLVFYLHVDLELYYCFSSKPVKSVFLSSIGYRS